MTKNLLKNTIDKGGEDSPLAANSSSSPSVPPAGFSAPPLEALPEGWILTTIEKIASPEKNSIVGGPFGSDLVQADYVQSGVPVIRGKNMEFGRYVGGEFVFVTEEKAGKLIANCAKPNDLIFTQRGTLGQVSLVPESEYRNYLVSQSQMKLTVDREKIDPLFVFYSFRTVQQQEYIKQNAIQVGVPHTNLGILKKTPILIPPLSCQQRITSILSSLDDKIALNRATNQILEEMAQALFKSWFVDFDPVHAKSRGELPVGMDYATAALFPDTFQESEMGLIPAGWEVKSLDTIADYLNGLALQKYPVVEGKPSLPVIKIAELKKGNSLDADRANNEVPEEYIIDDGDVVFSWSGSLFVDIWCGGRGALNQHLFKVSSNTIPKWLYFLWTKNHLQSFQQIAADKAVTMGHIKRSHLTEAKCCIPPSSVIGKISPKFTSLLDEQILLRLESTKLAELRDNLLPKLLSGEISVRNIPKQDRGV